MNEVVFKEHLYQVFLLSCPASFPVNFAIHPWFVINHKGRVSRWEVSAIKRDRSLSSGHLNKDLFPPFQGIEAIPFSKLHWSSKVLAVIEGDEDSIAARGAKCGWSTPMASRSAARLAAAR